MMPGSLPLPVGRLVFSASLAAECGFVMADNGQGSGAATPEDVAATPFGIGHQPGRPAPTLPRKGPCGCAASPAPVFFAPALGTRSGALLLDRGRSPRR